MIVFDSMDVFLLLFTPLLVPQGISFFSSSHNYFLPFSIRRPSICIFYHSLNSIKMFSIKLFFSPFFHHHSSLVYVNERKIERGQHNIYFNCELFNERFIEYCFVYVTEAKTGAVSDIRSDCVPTSPVYGKLQFN